jgi:malate permease and related proteins
MTETLFHAFTPLIFWTSLGILLFRVLPQQLPKLLGKTLYWVGVPVEILALARQTNYGENAGLAPLVTAISLGIGLGLGWLAMPLIFDHRENTPATGQNNGDRGSFLLCGMLGNTGFVGLAIVPQLVGASHMSWAIFYSVTQNVIGTYGLGVLISSFYGRKGTAPHWRTQLQDLLTVPSLWAFAIGSLTRSVPLPTNLEAGLQASIWVVIPGAFLLMGMRLSQIKGWQSLHLAFLPVTIKILLMPIGMGLVTSLCGLTSEDRLALVLMAGMPTAFAGLILAEEYELNRDLIASSIICSTLMMPLSILLWLRIYG